MVARVFTRKEREVWQACDALFESGIELERITINLIGNQLLGLGFKRGSDSAIHQHRLSWRSEISQKIISSGHPKRLISEHKHSTDSNSNILDVSESNNTEQSITDRITRAAGVFKTEIYTEVQQEVEHFKQKTETKIRTLEETCLEQQEAINAFKTELERVQQDRDHAQTTVSDLTQKLESAHETILKLTQKIEDLEFSTQQELTRLQTDSADQIKKMTDFSNQALQHSQLSVEKQLEYSDKKTASQIAELQNEMEASRQAWLLDQDRTRTYIQKITQEFQKSQIPQLQEALKKQLNALEQAQLVQHNRLTENIAQNLQKTIQAHLQAYQSASDIRMAQWEQSLITCLMQIRI